MKVYHGSYIKIKRIDFKKCHPSRDFGRGFYVTKIRSQAEVWAIRKGKDRGIEGIVTEFKFYEAAFNDWDLNCKRFDGYTEEWLEFVVMNRNDKIEQPSHDYDIVEGPVADDDVGSRVVDYIDGEISRQQFLSELTSRFPSHQICFCTHRSLQALEHIVYDRTYYKIKETSKQIIRELVFDKGLNETAATIRFYNSDVFALLSDETTGFYEKSWEEIYKLLLRELKNKK